MDIAPNRLAYLLLGLRILAVDAKFIEANPGDLRRHIALGILAPLCLSILLCASAPAIYAAAERQALIRSVTQESPLKRAVADVCAHLFSDPNYILQIPQGVGWSYHRVGSNDHVLIRRDATGEAYWFDVAELVKLLEATFVSDRDPLLKRPFPTMTSGQRNATLSTCSNLFWWN